MQTRMCTGAWINVEDYKTCVKSEYHVENRTVVRDIIGPVVMCFIVNALDVVVAKKNNPLAAYHWIEQHTKGK